MSSTEELALIRAKLDAAEYLLADVARLTSSVPPPLTTQEVSDASEFPLFTDGATLEPTLVEELLEGGEPAREAETCDLCHARMRDVGYGSARCPNCGAEWEWQEHVALVLPDDMQDQIDHITLALLLLRKKELEEIQSRIFVED